MVAFGKTATQISNVTALERLARTTENCFCVLKRILEIENNNCFVMFNVLYFSNVQCVYT